MSAGELKFLVDVGVSKKVELWLQKQGYDIRTVRDMNPRMRDKEILKIAASENRMLITMDKDFGELVYNSGLSHSGVLLLRLEQESSVEKVKIVENILERYSDKLLSNFCVFKEGKLRIRK